jgi:Ca2+-binding RTX toxin-like protein
MGKSGGAGLQHQGGPDHAGLRYSADDVQLGTSGADSLTADGSHTVVNGLAGADSIAGTANAEVLYGAAGADTLDGGAGNDTLIGGQGADVLTGGGGNDVFHIDGCGAHDTLSASTIDQVTDFTSGEDHLQIGHGAATAANFATSTAADFDAALTAANSLFAAGTAHYVAVQIGSDVLVFAEGHGHSAETAALLVGKSLSDISYSDIAG